MDLTINRGDNETLEFTFTDIDGNVIDLTNGTVYFTVKKKKTDSDDDAVLYTYTSTFNAPETGIMTFDLTPTQTDITPDLYYYDVQLRDGSGSLSSSAVGRIEVRQDITSRIS